MPEPFDSPRPPLGRVALRGIEGFGRHGVYPAEREHGQSFVVDLVCELDLDRAAASDDLADTIDYSELAGSVVAEIEGPPVDLIETLAARIAASCLQTRLVETVEVTVHKPQAPMPWSVRDVAVTLTRRRRQQ